MSSKYKFGDEHNMHFVTCTVVGWADVFIRPVYRDVITDSIRYCQQAKQMELYAFCLMTSHLHMIFRSGAGQKPQHLMRDFKGFTSRKFRSMFKDTDNFEESRSEWLLPLLNNAGERNAHNKDFQFWIQDNHPIEIWTEEVFHQKLEYIHMNPVGAGFVDEPEDWLYSSARNYAGKRSVLEVLLT